MIALFLVKVKRETQEDSTVSFFFFSTKKVNLKQIGKMLRFDKAE